MARFWDNSENMAQLIRLVDLKMTAREIAAAMGKSRNSVLGVCHRKNIALARALGNPERGAHLRRKSGPKPRQPAAVAVLPPDETDICAPVPLEDLDNKTQCHWPVNDGSPFLYCAMPSVHRGYCARHARAKLPQAQNKENAA